MSQATIQKGYVQWIADPVRARSGEVDFGAWWRWPGQDFPTWRISWIEKTGELYAVEERGDSFIVIGVFPNEEAVESAMEGWTKCANNLAAIIVQARGGPQAPRISTPEPTPEVIVELDTTLLEEHDSADPEIAPHLPLLQSGGKVYRGVRVEDGEPKVYVLQMADGKVKSYPLPHVEFHSESLSWNYGGSGPADLALSVLADYFGEKPSPKQLHLGECRCWHYHQLFKLAFIARAEYNGFAITSTEIAAWLEDQEGAQ